MATEPSSGPTPSSATATGHPRAPATTGTPWMVTTVSRKPSAVCRVSAVPTYRWSTTVPRHAENIAESAITEAPHTTSSGTSTHSGAPKSTAASRQQTPPTTAAPAAARARPHRSPTSPASRQPARPPMPKATKTSSPTVARGAGSSRATRLAVRYAGAQAHTA